MTKQNITKETKTDSKPQPNLEPPISAELSDPSAGAAPLLGIPVASAGDADVDSHAARLGDPNLQTAQRQALASQLARVGGNQQLQRVIASVQRRKKSGRAHTAQHQHSSQAGLVAQRNGPGGEAAGAGGELTATEQSMASLYWQRRREDPAWASQIHAVIDRRFWERTGYKVGQRLNPQLAEDRPYVRVWLQIRDEVMAEYASSGRQPGATEGEAGAQGGRAEAEAEPAAPAGEEITFEESEVEPIESELNGQPIHDALVLLRGSPTLLERNTAELIDTGRLHARYIQDCPVDPQSNALLTGWGYNTAQYIVRLHPVTNEKMIIQTNATGFAHGDHIFVTNTSTVEDTKVTLIHESSHALRGDVQSTRQAGSFARYRDEFQAYWIADFAGVADLDQRAQQIKQHILASYPALSASYNSDADFKEQVDNHTRPDANVLNSPRWEGVQRGVAGLGTDEEAVYRNIRAMSPEERTAVRNDRNFMALLEGDMSGDELQKAIMLLENYSEHTIRCIDAMAGWGTDEDAIFENLGQMGSTEKARLRGNTWFMERLRGELSGSDLSRALGLLGAQ